jgi:hypothetical protein
MPMLLRRMRRTTFCAACHSLGMQHLNCLRLSLTAGVLCNAPVLILGRYTPLSTASALPSVPRLKAAALAAQ